MKALIPLGLALLLAILVCWLAESERPVEGSPSPVSATERHQPASAGQLPDPPAAPPPTRPHPHSSRDSIPPEIEPDPPFLGNPKR